MAANETAIDLECREKGLDIVMYPLYRIFQVLYTLLSTASIPLLVYVQIKYIFGSTFHGNIKIILLLYYSMALLHSLGFSIVQIYGVLSSLLNKPCNFFPSIYIYIPLHLSISLPHWGMILSLVAVCCERIVATIRSSKYESNGIAFGLFLLAMVILGVFAATEYVYKFEDFNVKVWSPFAIPPGAVAKFNQISMLTTIIGFVCIITLYVSSRMNKKRCSVRNATLTSRYQTHENIITTEFATRIATLQVLFSVLYGAGGILIRILGHKLLSNNEILHISARQIFYTIPIFTLVLPIYSIYRLKRSRLQREDNIRSIVMMESRGVVGTQNYERVIATSWKLN